VFCIAITFPMTGCAAVAGYASASHSGFRDERSLSSAQVTAAGHHLAA